MVVLASEALARSERHRLEVWDQHHAWNWAAAGKDRPIKLL